MTHIDVEGAKLWVEEYGSGEQVVLCSALGFARYPAVLAEPPTNCHVFTIQARGFGRSTQLPEPPAVGWLNQWADDVAAVADRLGVDRFVYTGVSHGAGIGWHLTRRHPHRLHAFVSVVGTPHDRTGDTSSSEGRRQIVANRKDPKVIEQQYRIIGGFTDSPEQAALREQTIADSVARVLAFSELEGRINQGMPFPEATTNEALAAALREVDVPVLLINGMRDGVISPESGLRAAVNVPHAKAVFFESEGHFIARERPELLVAEIATFLDSLTVPV